ncbi:hypothetical protein B0H17DRAFT_1010524 [Mycena rosella]|uniref:DUF6534 domain-containing protein n=1 Tax=Mycena rosella TaxID=1033263 RepID=A0AAD7GFK3_MYCRO|nr:hypothetical protein B0H17DRAFT_1010524 [Mycena rosella]
MIYKSPYFQELYSCFSPRESLSAMEPVVTPSLPQPVEFSGPLWLTHILHWGLFGALSVQLYLYYQAFPNDKRSTKCLVYGIYAIELVSTILISHDGFAIFGYGFGDVSHLTRVGFDWLDVPVMSSLISFTGQSFYAYRLHIFSNSWILPALIVVASDSASLSCSNIYNGRQISLVSSIGGIAQGIIRCCDVWCGASALSDIMIAVCMTYYLSKYDGGFRQTRVLVSKIIRLTIETGLLTGLVTLITLILLLAFPTKGYWIAPIALIPELYANSVLVVLNSRLQIVGGRSTYTSAIDHVFSTETTTAPAFLGRTGAATVNENSERPHLVTITREVFSDRVSHGDGQIEMKSMGVGSESR